MQSEPAVGVIAQIEDIDGNRASATTNASGNFYFASTVFSPHYPIQIKVASADGLISKTMQSVSAREGSCATCHAGSPTQTSPGRVYLSTSGFDGGTDG